MIDTKTNRKNLYLKLTDLDFVTKLKPLLEKQGYMMRLEDGKFVPRQVSSAVEVPWVYVKTDPNSRCDIAHTIFHQILNTIPPYCRECYKVVVRPRTVVELFNLYEFQRMMDVPCKCGIEKRDTVNGLYGGYFYCRGLDQGQERYKQVRNLVDEHLSVDTPVLLKRYCTEFEIGVDSLGPSNKYPDATPEDLALEQTIYNLVPRVGVSTPQSEHQIAYIMRSWIHYAHKHGDVTYKEFTDGSSLVQDYITYHEGVSNGHPVE